MSYKDRGGHVFNLFWQALNETMTPDHQGNVRICRMLFELLMDIKEI